MFLDYKDISSRESYEYYRENRKKPAKGIDQYNYFRKAVEGLMLVLQEEMIHSEEGVCLKDWGYFCFIKSPKKRRRNKPSKGLLEQYKFNYEYSPYFFPDDLVEGWTMSDSFEPNIGKKRVGLDMEYRLYPQLCKDYIINLDFSEKNKKRGVLKNEYHFNYKKENRR